MPQMNPEVRLMGNQQMQRLNRLHEEIEAKNAREIQENSLLNAQLDRDTKAFQKMIRQAITSASDVYEKAQRLNLTGQKKQ